MQQPPSKPEPSCADANEFGLLRVEEVLRRVVASVRPAGGYEHVPLHQALGRVLKSGIVSPIDVPAHTNSAVDGYAIMADDLPAAGKTAQLRLAGTVLAGQVPAGRIEKDQSVHIMTGAPLPEGADTVLMQEQVKRQGETIVLGEGHRRGENVRAAGEDMRAGENVLIAGRLCTPADIGLLASLGLCEVQVRRRPRIALLSTGDELCDVGERRGPGGIFDSNRYTLRAALTRLGVQVQDLGVAADNKTALLEALRVAARRSDAIIATGGVSVGEADYTKSALAEVGTIELWKVAIKPGRPFAFGRIQDVPFFGLPGNPVAVMVTFYLFVLPALEKIMGITEKLLAPTLSAVSTDRIRKKSGRTEIQRGILHRSEEGRWQVRTTGKQGSGILRSMSLANAFIILPHEGGSIEPGDTVTVQPFAGLV
jgi:molybdopterin molybdotransferase